ncbi:methionine synthase [Sciscionella sediminilitoris]|uniref:methionine synthase n=1 Tax=Sciscionella sediminilitoris TaxID=1445613 RepID=UPI0004DF5D4D|nr:methionine synthase [Sciscionella sp. SE31]
MTENLIKAGATGIGSMPGTEVAEAVRTVFGELELPHVPELPARGVGADLIGRTAAILVDLPTEVVPSGYRVTARPGRDTRRGLDLLERDLDTVHELAGSPRQVKVQLAGPWTLTAGIELPRGQRVLTDHGALREFTASLIEGMRAHIAEVVRRTEAEVFVQLDEPSLPFVLIGGLATPSGYGKLPAVAEPEVRALLTEVLEAARAATGNPVIVHCCAPLSGDLAVPIAMLHKAGADALALDVTGFAKASATVSDALGEAIEDGLALLLGLVPSTGQGGELRSLAAPALELVDRLGFDRALLAERCVVTPSCGLAGARPAEAPAILRRCTELAAAFTEPPESWA